MRDFLSSLYVFVFQNGIDRTHPYVIRSRKGALIIVSPSFFQIRSMEFSVSQDQHINCHFRFLWEPLHCSVSLFKTFRRRLCSGLITRFTVNFDPNSQLRTCAGLCRNEINLLRTSISYILENCESQYQEIATGIIKFCNEINKC